MDGGCAGNMRILVHRSLLRARLYLIPRLPNFRGHYSEKCGTGLELLNDARRERMRSNIAMLQRPKAGGDVVWDEFR